MYIRQTSFSVYQNTTHEFAIILDVHAGKKERYTLYQKSIKSGKLTIIGRELQLENCLTILRKKKAILKNNATRRGAS